MSLRPDDPRLLGLKQAANEARHQSAIIEKQLEKYSDEELERELDRNESLREFLSIDADKDNSNIRINYMNQPQNGQQSYSYSPTWNMTTGYIQNPYMMGYYANNFMYQNDERIKVYNEHPGMKLYGISPYNFYNATQLLDYYNYLETERKKQQDFNYFFLTFTTEDNEWAEPYKFKPADDIVKDQIEERCKAEEERRKALEEFEDEDYSRRTIYDRYDANGYIIRRSPVIIISDPETGEILQKLGEGKRKDENGRSYVIRTYAEEQKEELELQQFYNEINKTIMFNNLVSYKMQKSYIDNKKRWAELEREGLSPLQIISTIDYEQVDWAAHERAIMRALQTTEYSRQKFNDILRECYNTEFKYSNRSRAFNLSYDWARDLKYRELTSTPEEMDNDPLVHQKLQEAYEVKRRIFMTRAETGNLQSDCGLLNFQNKPTMPKPNIDDLTLEDFQKPENHIMYSDISSPELHTDNLFIPELKDMSEIEIMKKNGVQFDANGNIIPIKRTITNVTVDDDTGQILSQQSYDVPPELYNPNLREASNSMTNEELADLY